MKFIRSLFKSGYTIYLYELPEGRYIIEYSDDGFGSKTKKEYPSRDALISMLEQMYSEEEMRGILKSFK